MTGSRRSVLTSLLGALGLSLLGGAVAGKQVTTDGYVVTRDGWVLRQSDLDLLR